MILNCRCGEKLRINNPPKQKIQVKCPTCGLETIYDLRSKKYKQEHCCICNQKCKEDNLLLNGEKYHKECLGKLKSKQTKYDSQIDTINEQISSLNKEINDILNSRSLFQTLLGKVPERVDYLKGSINKLKIDIKDLKSDKEKIIYSNQNKLKAIYDNWPSRPPDWDQRAETKKNLISYCSTCYKRSFYSNPLHVHHIVPISRGGNHTSNNLEVLCSECHQKKHGHSFSSSYNKSNNEYEDSNTKFREKLDAVEKANRTNVYLKFKYKRFQGGRDSHYVKIQSVFNKNNRTYFRGYCILNNAERDFIVDKIYQQQVKQNPPSRKLPSEYIDEAIKKGKILHFKYQKGNGDISVRSLKPEGYTTYKGVRVLNGFDYLKKEIRNFAPHRMSNIEVVDTPKECRVITGTG